MTCPFTPSQLRAISKPDAIEDAIAAIIAERMDEMLDRSLREMCARTRSTSRRWSMRFEADDIENAARAEIAAAKRQRSWAA